MAVETRRPAYLALLETGELERRVEAAWARLAACDLCPHACGADRLRGQEGFCRTGNQAVVASTGPHFGEEAPLVGRSGSGAVFFGRCNLRCLYCQNYEISQGGEGRPVTPEVLAFLFLALQEQGCHNVNLVSPSHVIPFILKAVALAAREGLRLPLVYNTGGYDAVSALRLLDGVVDIYMPDFKYWDAATARRLSGARDYPAAARAAVLEMHRQVGDLEIGPDRVARRGLLVRHLVLPGGLAGTREVLAFLAREVSPATWVNLMGQYRPCGRAMDHPPLDRRPLPAEFEAAEAAWRASGLRNRLG
ncbi:radical SAM protein [Dissulfurirhabdus thermomarina]|uniref:Radical SAM protein n=1 Tax=Dissulfurirhabdus thermomarina TaxID=1765737 RepID=A0A6N9TRY5_DISTH|nr:radical SAM protein [Dissulfurirhabdus thermomarina]NDY42207.1 radical SAM protein [Dissulfurirhabdus thermomarina]NMX22665.1 radical SAM protein [Dissulfurirhabdus thermomarina]